MKKRVIFILILALVLMVVAPLAAFAAYTPTSGYKVVDDNDASITYSGTGWIKDNGVFNAIGGNAQYSNTTNDYLQFTYSGTNANLNFVTSSTGGKATVIVDGVSYTVDTYSSTTNSAYTYSTTGLTAGTHTIKIVVSGTRNASSTRNDVEFGGYEYEPYPPIGVTGATVTPTGVSPNNGLFDGVIINNWTSNVFYWNGSGVHYDFTINKPVNIWRYGTTSWSSYTGVLSVLKLNADGTTYTDVGTQYNLPVTAITDKQSEKFIQNLPAGTYRFQYLSGLRLDSEWYLEDASPAMAAPSGLSGTPTYNSVNLSWSAVTDPSLASYKVYRNSSYVGSVTKPTATYNDTGLASGTSYSYQVSWVNSSGTESGKSSIVSVTTLAPKTTPPPIPTNLTASNVVGGSVNLAWDMNSTSDSTFAGWNLYKNGTKVNSSLLVSNAYTASGLSDNTSYTFYVKSVDTFGNESAASNAVSTMHDTISPLAPVGLAVNGKTVDSSGSTANVTLTWTPNSEPDLAGYNVYANLQKSNTSLITATSYNVNGLTANVVYSFQITAVDTSTNESLKSAAVNYTYDTQPPSVPIGLNLVAGDTTINAHWNAEGSPDLAGYNLYRDGTKINTSLITTTDYVDTGLINGTSYSYQVSAVDKVGNESAKSAAKSMTPVQPALPPVSPIGLSVASRDAALTVSWNLVPSATGYNLYVNGVLKNGSPITGKTFDLTGLTNDQIYNIQVTAVNSVGEGSKSAAVLGKPSSKSLPIVSYMYSLSDIVTGVGSWFGSIWMILAFSIAIPLSFVVGRRVKGLFE